MGLQGDVRLRQPAKHDLVSEEILVCGVGSGFEGTIDIRVLTTAGREVAHTFAQSAAGGVGIGEFSTSVRLPRPPRPGTRLVVEASGSSGEGPGTNPRRVEVICFPGTTGWLLYRVERGETLTGIVRGLRDLTRTTVAQVVAANPTISDPDVIRVGQRLRVPLRP